MWRDDWCLTITTSKFGGGKLTGGVCMYRDDTGGLSGLGCGGSYRVLDQSWRGGKQTQTYGAAATLVMRLLTCLFIYTTHAQQVNGWLLHHSALTQRHVMTKLEICLTLLQSGSTSVSLNHTENLKIHRAESSPGLNHAPSSSEMISIRRNEKTQDPT